MSLLRRVDKRDAVLFLLTLGALAALGSFGFHISDEADWGVAASAILQGRSTIGEVPLEYYEGTTSWTSRIEQHAGHGYWIEPKALAWLSFPVYGLLLAWALVAPVRLAFVLIAVGALAGALDITFRGRLTRWQREVLWATAAALVVWNAALLGPDISELWLPPIAAQLTTMLLTALGIAMFHRGMRAIAPRAATAATVVLGLGTTTIFWAFGQKYHGAQLALLCIALGLRFGTSDRTRGALAAAFVAGLALWIHPKAGALLAAALLAAEIPPLFRRAAPRSARGSRLALVAVALALGFAPQLAENAVIYGDPMTFSYTAVAMPSAPAPMPATEAPAAPDGAIVQGGDPPPTPPPAPPAFQTQAPVEVARASLEKRTILHRWDGLPVALWATWVHPGELTPNVHVQFGVLMLSPLLALALFGLILRLRRPGDVEVFSLAFCAALLFLYGETSARPGGGAYDSRYVLIVAPILALYAGLALDHALRRVEARLAWAVVALAATVLAGSILLLWAVTGADYTRQLWDLRRIGLLVLPLVLLLGAASLLYAPRLAALPVLALGFVPPALFILQYVVHHPPRAILVAGEELAHFLPLTQLASHALDLLVGS